MTVQSRVLTAVAVVVGVTGFTVGQADAKRQQVAKIRQLKVVAQTVQGTTTKGAKVTLYRSGHRAVGHGKANARGHFRIKLRRALKTGTFQLKVTKKGYQARVTNLRYRAPKPVKPAKPNRPAPVKPVVPAPVAPEPAPTTPPVMPVPAQPATPPVTTESGLRQQIVSLTKDLTKTENSLQRATQNRTFLTAELTDAQEDLQRARTTVATAAPGSDAYVNAQSSLEWLVPAVQERQEKVTQNQRRLVQLQHYRTALRQSLAQLNQRLTEWLLNH